LGEKRQREEKRDVEGEKRGRERERGRGERSVG
jgi:hypothetical protein